MASRARKDKMRSRTGLRRGLGRPARIRRHSSQNQAMRDASATSPGQGAVCDARSGVPSGLMGTSTSASSDHHVGAHAAAAATCPKLQRPNVQAIPAAFSMGRAVAAASTELGHENLSMFNDVRKSDASQRVAARTDFFGRTNHACWEQPADHAAADSKAAQTADVHSVVGTIVTTAFTNAAAAVNSPSPNTTRGDAMQWMRCFGPNAADARTSRRGAI